MFKVKIYSLILSLLCLLSCENSSVSPQFKDFDGEWELVKIVNGFAQIEITQPEIGYKEILEIDGANKNLKIIRNNNVTLDTKLEVRKEQGQDALILLKDQTYNWYFFVSEAGISYLVLYQNSPIGSVLADGSNYFYTKK